MLCHCNSQKLFQECCEPIHRDMAFAKTAEQLMRSRYSAFVAANIDYLMSSHYASTRPLKEKNDILKWTKSVTWVRLEIIAAKAGLEDDTQALVEFKAFFMENGRLECIHENSYFVKEQGLWYYKAGEHK